MQLIENLPITLHPAYRILAASEYRSKIALERLKETAIREFKSFWHNTQATPEEQLAIMGNKAVGAFAAHQATITFLLGQGIQMNTEDYLPPVAFTMHQDGTITIN
jgi:hypothetical protein